MQVTVDVILLSSMVVAGVWAVMARSLLKAAIGLAITSAIVTVIMFRLYAPLAAVFELSVCAGLITAIFVSATSLTRPLTHKESVLLSRSKFRRYWYLPLIMIAAGIALLSVEIPLTMPSVTVQGAQEDPRVIMWNDRQIDLIGQIIILIVGAFGVVILFKERKRR